MLKLAIGGRLGTRFGSLPSKLSVNAALSPVAMVSRSSDTVKFAAIVMAGSKSQHKIANKAEKIPRAGRRGRTALCPGNGDVFCIISSAQSFANEIGLCKHPLEPVVPTSFRRQRARGWPNVLWTG